MDIDWTNVKTRKEYDKDEHIHKKLGLYREQVKKIK